MKILEVLQNKTLRAVLIFFFGIALLVGFLFTQGCAYVTAGDVTYFRIGNQSISGMNIETPDGWVITFDQASKTEAMKTALSIAEALK